MAPSNELEKIQEIPAREMPIRDVTTDRVPKMTPNLRRVPSYSELPSPAISRSPSPHGSRTPSIGALTPRSVSASPGPISAPTSPVTKSPVRAMTPTVGAARSASTPRQRYTGEKTKDTGEKTKDAGEKTKDASEPYSRKEYHRAASPSPGPLYGTSISNSRSGSAPSRLAPRLFSERTTVTPMNLDQVREELERDMKKELDKIRTQSTREVEPATKTETATKTYTSTVTPLGTPKMQILIPIKAGRVAPGHTPDAYRTHETKDSVATTPKPDTEPIVVEKSEPTVIATTPKLDAKPTTPSRHPPNLEPELEPPNLEPPNLPHASGTGPSSVSAILETMNETLDKISAKIPAKSQKLKPSTQAVRKEQIKRRSSPSPHPERTFEQRITEVSVPGELSANRPAAVTTTSASKKGKELQLRPSKPSKSPSRESGNTSPEDDADTDFTCGAPSIFSSKGSASRGSLLLDTPADDKDNAPGVNLSEEQMAEALKLYMRVNDEDFGILHDGDVIAYINAKGGFVKDVTLKRIARSKRSNHLLWYMEIYYSGQFRRSYATRAENIKRVWKRVGLESASLARSLDMLREDVSDIRAFLEQRFPSEFRRFITQREASRGPRFRPGDALTPKSDKNLQSAPAFVTRF